MADETAATPQSSAPSHSGGSSSGGHSSSSHSSGGHSSGGPGGGSGGPGGGSGGPGGPRTGGPRPGGAGGRKFFRRKKVCKFCVEKIEAIPYRDVRLLQQFVAERGKITPRRLTGVLHDAPAPAYARDQAGAQHRAAALRRTLLKNLSTHAN